MSPIIDNYTLWKLPTDDILERVSEIVNAEIPEWTGTATELISKLSLDIQPNTMTRHLNVNADRLFYEYQIAYENTRTHSGRQVTFRYVPKEE